ncbi:MAG TPA: serine/threonine-protein kinase [Acidobacteriota bacterium]|nr:serine/threonine-protein kinase [Acidobacteriota bacterium]
MTLAQEPRHPHVQTPFRRFDSQPGGPVLHRELAETGVRRLGMMALVYAAVSLAYFIIPKVPVAMEGFQRYFGLAMVVVSVGVFLATRYLDWDPWLMLDLGLSYEVLGALGIEIWILRWQGGWWEGAETVWGHGISWTCVWLVCFPLLVPTTKGKALLAALAAASVRPLMLLIAISGGAPSPDLAEAALWVAPNYLCVGIAMVSAHVVYSLGTAVSEARKMGSYQLVERLGAGGMGEVWRAQHEMLARPAAVKLIRPEVLGVDEAQGRQLTARFEREARATASLTSPHTVGLYDFGVAPDGTFYYVMELLQGLDLEMLVERFGPLPAPRAVHLLRQACASLREAHAAGIVHRDIKPANLYVCKLGLEHDFVKVLDFGLVKKIEGDDQSTALTLENTTAGTPQFMAPEMALGKDFDARADIYALACTAYWMLTGCHVFEGAGALQVIMEHVQTPPIAPSQRTELSIPQGLDELILQCLAKDPARRPGSVEAFSQGLCALDDQSWTESDAARWWALHLPDLTGRSSRGSAPPAA